MTREQIIEFDKNNIMNTYGRLDLVPEEARGAVIKDKNGKEYIDFTSGIGVNIFGWNDEGWKSAVIDQIGRFQHVCNYYYCDKAAELAHMICEKTGLTNMFFSNSGAEANEGAIKLARKYSFDKYGAGRSTIITLNSSFHGRTVTTLAATGQDVFHNYFFPFTEGFKYCEPANIDALHEACTEDVCAVMLEVVQGEGGVNIMPADYIKAVRALCDERDILMIVDEVQTGIGRCGKFFGYMNYGITPDIVTSAKGLGGGLPIGAFISGEKCSKTLGGGMHGSTFGANPVSTAAAAYIVSKIDDDFLNEVNKKGEYIREKISAIDSDKIKEVRGVGMMIGIAVTVSPKDILHYAFDAGLLVLTAGKDVVRLLPPLSISYKEIDRGIEILEKILK
ncbi:MAG: aspartate aminotransferase family protein [Ruminococcaceae bacterium]|nr:aspartate aminotransferase family protein [Oscillospiraceae bacterium]